MEDKFLRAKKGRLGRADKSSIGSIDKQILGLCEKINSNNDYYTLSSCSGRIVLIKETADKQAGLFIQIMGTRRRYSCNPRKIQLFLCSRRLS